MTGRLIRWGRMTVRGDEAAYLVAERGGKLSAGRLIISNGQTGPHLRELVALGFGSSFVGGVTAPPR
jgi:predicted ABC-type sugar transport system permease subunit